MGYRSAGRPRFALNFEEPHPLAGLRVVLRSMSLADFLRVAEMSVPTSPGAVKDGEAGQIRDVFNLIVQHTVEWNLEDDDGNPVLIGPAAIDHVDLPFILTLFLEWQKAVADVVTPLVESAGSTGISQAVHIPTEPLSSPPLNYATR